MIELRAEPRSVRKRLAGAAVGRMPSRLAMPSIASAKSCSPSATRITSWKSVAKSAARAAAGVAAWRIAVERPQTVPRTVQAVVALVDLGISTSGDYRDFRVLEGRRISPCDRSAERHPVTHALASVSVVHRSVMLADACDALMVLGPQEGFALAERLGLARSSSFA